MSVSKGGVKEIDEDEGVIKVASTAKKKILPT